VKSIEVEGKGSGVCEWSCVCWEMKETCEERTKICGPTQNNLFTKKTIF